MAQVEIKQAQEQFIELIEMAANGEEVVISKGERPLVKISSIAKPKRQR